ncbi:hypothetical protein CcI49_27505 [Frankia sp. CcI49]|uniref:hypothetical protein n=1 Tax=Frankia sp. CcI49 TaxID=1745382 RepID=UPI0009766EBA|nr:hypothetical protein [Frankia sp. CcI49]ONH56207.1 hypothetical protein CcI49_27505 [Frankia sp. CcI49]
MTAIDSTDLDSRRQAIRPQARLWWAFDLDPRTASAWVGRAPGGAYVVNIPVGSDVAPLVGIQGYPTGNGKTRRRCLLANVPELLRPLVDIAVSQWITRPQDHPMASRILTSHQAVTSS